MPNELLNPLPENIGNQQVSSDILVVEDDEQVLDLISSFLEVHNYIVDIAENGKSALVKLEQSRYSCIVLDLNLPDEDGLVLLRKIRMLTDTPVIICSGRETTTDRISGLEMGAQDYLTKPFSSQELLLRVKSLIAMTKHSEVKRLTNFGRFALDNENKTIRLDSSAEQSVNNEVYLTKHEFLLLKAMSKHPGRVYSRQELLDSFGNIEGAESDRSVDTIVSRLRKKVEVETGVELGLITVRGFGYKLT